MRRSRFESLARSMLLKRPIEHVMIGVDVCHLGTYANPPTVDRKHIQDTGMPELTIYENRRVPYRMSDF